MGGKLYPRARFRINGDRALLVEYGEGVDLTVNEKVRRMAAIVTQRSPAGVEAVIPSYRSLCIMYDPQQITPARLQDQLLEWETGQDQTAIPPSQTVVIPVCYGGEFGPDIQFVAEHNNITIDQVVQLHSQNPYHIYAIGFAPGFCYLGGLDERLHTPRLATPRTFVPAGSVGIAAAQTGVYPLDTPGGWQLIGRTPLRLFVPHRTPPILYRTGDRIRFSAITADDYERLRREEKTA